MKEKILRDIACLNTSNNLSEAIKLAEDSYKKTNDNCYLNEIVKIHTKQGNKEKAIAILLKMLETEPENVVLIKKLACNYFYKGEFKNALKYYLEVLKFEPEMSQNYFNVASAYDFLKDYRNSYIYYKNAIKLDPTNVSAINNLGLVFYETKNLEEAIKMFETAIRTNPSHPEAYHHMGMMNREYKNDLELSELYYKKAIRLDPKHLPNTYELAVTYEKAGKIEKAKEALTKCLEMNPNHKQSQELLKKLSI